MALRERKRPGKDDSSESDGDQQGAGDPGLQETKSLQEVVKRRESGSTTPRTLASMAERAGKQKRDEIAGKPTNQDGSNKSTRSVGTDKPTVEKPPTSPSIESGSIAPTTVEIIKEKEPKGKVQEQENVATSTSGENKGGTDEARGMDSPFDVDEERQDLTEMERDVLGVARESLKLKRHPAKIGFQPYTPMVERLYNDCLARFHAQKGYSKEDIIQTIKDLEAKRWIITAERRTKAEILESKLYQEILSFIHDYPGIHARDDRVQEIIGITRNPFLKHLLVLERFKLIVKHKHGKMWNFFTKDFDAGDAMERLIVLLYNDVARQIVPLLLENPEYTLQEIAERIIPPVFHGSVQYHLKKFKKIDFVRQEGGKREINLEMLAAYNNLVCPALQIKP